MQKYYINSLASIHPESTDGDRCLASEPDYKLIITNAGQRRRMSRIIKMGVACALQCMKDYSSSDIHSIITATGLGCLSDTEKFMSTLVENDERLLNPTPFIQSTPNTIGGQIALICQIHAYNVTYSHRGFSFETGLIDAMMRINEGDQQVLVGAMDEITESSLIIQKRMGIMNGIKAGEGAQFFMLSHQPTKHSYAQLRDVLTFSSPDSKEELEGKITSFLASQHLKCEDLDCLMTGRNGHITQDCIYEDVEKLFPQASYHTFKDTCGEYQTASAFALYKASNLLKEQKEIKNILIYNHYNNINHTLILISQCL